MGPAEYKPDRRPITSRDKNASKKLAGWLVARGVTPNAISISGMVAGLAAGIAFAASSFEGWRVAGFVGAAILMQLRLLANMLDGMVAVETNVASAVGELYNEVPDRVSDTAMFIGAGYALGGVPELGYMAACLALFIAYLRAQGGAVGTSQEFCGPMAKPQRVFLMTLAALYTGLAPATWQLRLSALPGWETIAFALFIVLLGCCLTALRRLKRIADALRKARS